MELPKLAGVRPPFLISTRTDNGFPTSSLGLPKPSHSDSCPLIVARRFDAGIQSLLPLAESGGKCFTVLGSSDISASRGLLSAFLVSSSTALAAFADSTAPTALISPRSVCSLIARLCTIISSRVRFRM